MDEHKSVPYDGFDEGVSEEVKSLARTFSRTSQLARSKTNSSFDSVGTAPGVLPFQNTDEIDQRLNPDSDEFNSKLWVKNMKKIYDSDPKYYKPVTMDFYFKNLMAHGDSTDADYQSDFLNYLPKNLGRFVGKHIIKKKLPQYNILKPMDGLVRNGELCVVLGKPGAGCTTFLKTVAAQTYGFEIDPNSEISYDGLTPKQIHSVYRGHVIYCAETEYHLPQLSVFDTLKFAALLKCPNNRPEGVTREQYAEHVTNVIMATYGLSHTRNTKVGNDFIRGVSGGERKRVSICEAALSNAVLQCWDNSTRGLDSATALEFIKALKTSASVSRATPLIAIYQCSQSAYDLFDKVQLLYEGYQIYFGDAKKAKDYFLRMGFDCPPRQTTADFLTSITSPNERFAKKGFEDKVPNTPKEFYDYWMNSPEHEALIQEIEEYKAELNKEPNPDAKFQETHTARQSRRLSPKSPYTVSFGMQTKYILQKNFIVLKNDPSIPLMSGISQFILALMISSVFYNLPKATHSFYSRTAALFFANLFNAFGSLLEIFSLYEARPVVEKHKTYALYHPAADAFASIISELPTKIFICIAFNFAFYFMVNLKREAGAFFFYMLINFTITLVMSHMFRTIGAATRTLSEAMTPATVILLILIIFTGFVIPTPNMHGWCRWINYLDPVSYAFEALIANEFHGVEYECSDFIPAGPGYPTSGSSRICSTVSSTPGATKIIGDEYIYTSFKYKWSHAWRNWGILIAYIFFFLATYILAAELNNGAMQKGEVLLFQKKYLKKIVPKIGDSKKDDIESGPNEKFGYTEADTSSDTEKSGKKIKGSNKIFHWRNLTYEVKIKNENRRILQDVSGYVEPGKVTALMGASGAGKTTLLNALSARLTTGVITSGSRMVNGHPLDNSFQRSIGYVQQQDLHLLTSTVREALLFSAKLRQPFSVPMKEKEEYVESVIDLLEMRPYADAVVGVAGEGLNVEQRKRLTIGVELAAKPELLVFLDEPTSGLDSQTAWSIIQLIRKLANQGQAILCTIHQPSAILMQDFDRLLFLQKGGETVYFGDLGENCQTMINYFEKYGAPKCPPNANPAEWMLEVIGAAPGSHANNNYFDVWQKSDEHAELMKKLDTMEVELAKLPVDEKTKNMSSYAAPLWYQSIVVLQRVFQQTWRTPNYIWSKIFLSVSAALFNGFVFFKAKKTLMGLQSQMFSIFMFMMVFMTLIQQYLPVFVFQRSLYEVRERPSKTFSWFSFILAQIISEIPWQILCGTLSFFCWYYPTGLYNNAVEAGDVHGRGVMMWVAITVFFVYSSTMGQVCISFIEDDAQAANLATLLFSLCLNFCGILVSPEALPGFWIFLYRVSPLTYLVAAMLAIGLKDSSVTCSTTEYLKFPPPSGMTCNDYMSSYIKKAGGYLLPSTQASTDECVFCQMNTTNAFLAALSIDPTEVGQNVGIFSCYIFINIALTIFLYWLARVPKGAQKRSC